MRIKRGSLGVSRPELRPGLEDEVRAILDEVRASGDDAVRRLSERFDGVGRRRAAGRPRGGRGGAASWSTRTCSTGCARRSRTCARWSEAQLREPVAVELDQGQRIEVAELPVRRAAIYVPGGRAPYPSTVVMGAVTARAAGVDEVVVCTPPGRDGGVNPVILAACALCEVDEVYRDGWRAGDRGARLRHRTPCGPST